MALFKTDPFPLGAENGGREIDYSTLPVKYNLKDAEGRVASKEVLSELTHTHFAVHLVDHECRLYHKLQLSFQCLKA